MKAGSPATDKHREEEQSCCCIHDVEPRNVAKSHMSSLEQASSEEDNMRVCVLNTTRVIRAVAIKSCISAFSPSGLYSIYVYSDTPELELSAASRAVRVQILKLHQQLM